MMNQKNNPISSGLLSVYVTQTWNFKNIVYDKKPACVNKLVSLIAWIFLFISTELKLSVTNGCYFFYDVFHSWCGFVFRLQYSIIITIIFFNKQWQYIWPESEILGWILSLLILRSVQSFGCPPHVTYRCDLRRCILLTNRVTFRRCKFKLVLPVKPWVCIGIWDIQDLSCSCHLTCYAFLYRKPTQRQTEFNLSMLRVCNETKHSEKAARQISWPGCQTYGSALEYDSA